MLLHDNFRDDFLSASYFAPRRALHITLHAMCDVLSEKTLIFYSTVCAEHCMSLRCDCQCIMLLTETNEMLLVCWLAFDCGKMSALQIIHWILIRLQLNGCANALLPGLKIEFSKSHQKPFGELKWSRRSVQQPAIVRSKKFSTAEQNRFAPFFIVTVAVVFLRHNRMK